MAGARVEAIGVLPEQHHALRIVARQAVTDYAGDDRSTGRAHAALDGIGRLARVQHARGALGAHHRVVHHGGIGECLRPRGLHRAGRDAAAVDLLLRHGVTGDAGARRGEMRVEDRGELPALVAVGRLAEDLVPQRHQPAVRRIGAGDRIGACLVVVGVRSGLQDLAPAGDEPVVEVLHARVVGLPRGPLIKRGVPSVKPSHSSQRIETTLHTSTTLRSTGNERHLAPVRPVAPQEWPTVARDCIGAE